VGTSKTSSRDLRLTYIWWKNFSRESVLLYLNRWSAMENDGQFWFDCFDRMVVKYKASRVDWLLPKLYTHASSFFSCFVRWAMLIVTNRYTIVCHWLQLSYNQLWYLRVSNSPEAGATSLRCHVVVRHRYGNISSVAGAKLFSTAFFLGTWNSGTNRCPSCSNAKNDYLFFLHEETNFRSSLAKRSWTALFIKLAVRRSLWCL
jgi:hypothetical protein